MRRNHRWWLLAGLILVAGCGGPTTYPVKGQLLYKDTQAPAKDLEGYLVTLESTEKPVGATGVVQADGSFTLTTYRNGDGAIPGKHRVAITPPYTAEGGRPPLKIHKRYTDFQTSGLEITVGPGTNELTPALEKPGK